MPPNPLVWAYSLLRNLSWARKAYVAHMPETLVLSINREEILISCNLWRAAPYSNKESVPLYTLVSLCSTIIQLSSPWTTLGSKGFLTFFSTASSWIENVSFHCTLLERQHCRGLGKKEKPHAPWGRHVSVIRGWAIVAIFGMARHWSSPSIVSCSHSKYACLSMISLTYRTTAAFRHVGWEVVPSSLWLTLVRRDSRS
jgi:hypothetical protein